MAVVNSLPSSFQTHPCRPCPKDLESQPCIPPVGMGICRSDPLATETCLIISVLLLTVLVSLNIPWIWVQVSSYFFNSKMEQRKEEINLAHEEECLRDRRRNQQAAETERMRTETHLIRQSLQNLSQSGLFAPERVFVTGGTLPRSHRAVFPLNDLQEGSEDFDFQQDVQLDVNSPAGSRAAAQRDEELRMEAMGKARATEAAARGSQMITNPLARPKRERPKTLNIEKH